MDIEPVDPRDIAWEDHQPVFRVTLWKRLANRVDSMWSSDEYEVRNADIKQVLTWAESREAQDKSIFTIDILVRNAPTIGVTRLIGVEPINPT